MHLFLGQSVNLISGTGEAKHKKVPPEENLLFNQVQNSKGSMAMMINNTFTKGESVKPEQNRGTVLSYLLKGEPPDVPIITKPHAYQGKTLDFQRRMKANMLCIGAGYTVSRSKLFQEGEYDEDIKSLSTKENGVDTNQMTKTLGESQHKHTKDISALIEAYQLNEYWIKTVALFFPYLGFFPLGLPRKVFNEATISHQEITEKWNGFKSSSHEEDIQVAIQQTSSEPAGDQQLLIEALRPNQEEPSFKPNCFGNLTHKGSPSSWNQANTNFGLRVINFLNRSSLNLPYLEAHGFSHLKTRLWRPGETLSQSEETPDQSGELDNILPCTNKHQIRRISLYSHFPYMATFTLGAINLQRLAHQDYCVLDHLYYKKNVPEKLTYPLKPSRYKGGTTSHILADLLIIVQRLVYAFIV